MAKNDDDNTIKVQFTGRDLIAVALSIIALSVVFNIAEKIIAAF